MQPNPLRGFIFRPCHNQTHLESEREGMEREIRVRRSEWMLSGMERQSEKKTRKEREGENKRVRVP